MGILIQLILALGLSAAAWSAVVVDLWGTVQDQNGKPLGSVVVSLASAGLSDTTANDGSFHLYLATIDPEPETPDPGDITLQLPKSNSVHSQNSLQYNAQGKLAAVGFQNARQALYSKAVQNNLLRYTGSTNQSRASAAVDQLNVSQNGEALAVIPVASYSANLGALSVVAYASFTDDRDNRSYRYVQIGSQYWMAQNLNYGTKVNATTAQNNDNLVEKYCYKDDTLNCNRWGGYYKWAEALALPYYCNSYTCTNKIDTTGHQGICPAGWKLPRKTDWANLVAGTTGDSAILGPMLRNDTGWSLTYNGSNDYGFSALPLGNRNAKSQFVNQGTHAYWWSAAEFDASSAWIEYLYGPKASAFNSYGLKLDNGFAVRCLYDGLLDSTGQPPVTPGAGYVIWEKWKHIRGETLDKVPWATAPGDTGRWTILQAPTNNDDRFGMRVRGYITAPYTGYYTFNTYTNGTGRFLLSTNKLSTNLREINAQANTVSSSVYLQRNTMYYFEAYWKENWVNEYFEIQWKTPDDAAGAPYAAVPGTWLSPAPLSTYRVNPPVCATITPTAKDSDWPAYCSAAEGNCGTFIDERNCQEYRWTQIGTQKWMAENLNIGTMINGSLDQSDDAVIEKYCYGNNAANCAVYGGLYQWHEAMGLPSSCDNSTCWDNSPQYGKQGICPDGWILPAQSDMQNLIDNTTGLDSTAATNLKSNTWSGSSTNELAFSAIPAGIRSTTNSFSGLGSNTKWWISEELLDGHSWLQMMDASSMLKRSYAIKKNAGQSIRCVSVGSQTIWGSVSWERWDGSYTISTIPTNTPPSKSGKWSTLEAPVNLMDAYAYRIRGYLVPPVDGSYTFWISADDGGQLHLSSSNSIATTSLIANTLWTFSREWMKATSQKSQPISLSKGNRYYFEIKQNEGASGDHVAVGWSLPNNPTSKPSEAIPARYIEPF